ncbi:MAG: hypothetical protein ABW026_15515 [Microvirga sp.]
MKRTWIVLACVATLLPHAAFALPREAKPPRGESARGCLPGFIPVADTSTCLKVSGGVRAEFVTGRAWGTGGGLRSEGRVGLDVRTQTGYGPLRTVVRVRTGRDGF